MPAYFCHSLWTHPLLNSKHHVVQDLDTQVFRWASDDLLAGEIAFELRGQALL